MFPMTLFFRTHQGFQGSPASGRHSQSTYSRALPQSHQFKQLGTPGKIWKRVSHLQKSKSKYVSEFTSLKMELIHVYTRENPGVLKTITFSHPFPWLWVSIPNSHHPRRVTLARAGPSAPVSRLRRPPRHVIVTMGDVNDI
jgi:hypothetical protein